MRLRVPTVPPLPCTVHPERRAAWRCSACERELCEACAAGAAAGRGELLVCAHCGALAEPLLVRRSQVQPFAASWPPALAPLAYPAVQGLIVVVFCASEYLAQLGPRGWLLGHALELGWFLMVARRAGRGYPPFGAPTWAEVGSIWLGPIARLLVSVGALALGAALLVDLGLAAASPGSAAIWLLAAASVWLVPPALAFAAVEGAGAAWVPPWRLARLEAGAPGGLRIVRGFVAAWTALLVLKAFQAPIEHADSQMTEKLLAAAAVHLPAVALLAALACVLGAWLRAHAEELGHGEERDWRVPLAPEARPEGRWLPPRDRAAALPREPAPDAIELVEPKQALLEALARGDADEALAQLRSGELRPDALEGEVHVQLAQLLAARGDSEAAANGLRALLHRDPRTPAAPRALVILARLCAERLGAQAEAEALYRQVVERFPGTAAARFAQEKLAPQTQS